MEKEDHPGYHEPNGTGIASLVFSIFAIIFIFLPFMGILFALLAIIFSFFTHNRVAKAGRIIGITALLLNAVALLFFAAFIGAALTKLKSTTEQFGEMKDKITNAENKLDKFEDVAQKYEQVEQYQGDCPGECVSDKSTCRGRIVFAECEKGWCCV